MHRQGWWTAQSTKHRKRHRRGDLPLAIYNKASPSAEGSQESAPSPLGSRAVLRRNGSLAFAVPHIGIGIRRPPGLHDGESMKLQVPDCRHA